MTEAEVTDLSDYLYAEDIFIVVHGTYLDRPFEGNNGAIHSILKQMKLISRINHRGNMMCIGPVIHLSKAFREYGMGPLSKLHQINAMLALETDAHKPTDIEDSDKLIHELFEQLYQIDRKHAIIFDTAHIYESGIDLHDPKVMTLFLHEVKKLIDDDQEIGFHLNDSKTELGSGHDQHELLGHGHVFSGAGGAQSLGLIMSFCLKNELFCVIENPQETVHTSIKKICSVLE
jgi:endonuclease IV